MDEQEEQEETKPAVKGPPPVRLIRPVEVIFPKRVPSVVKPKRVPVYITPDKTTCVECPCFPKESPYRKPPKLRECQQSPLTLYEYAAKVVDDLKFPEAFDWSEQKVAKWMDEVVGLPQYMETMIHNRINGRRLLLLEDMTLPEVNIRNFEHVKMIVTQIHKLYSTEFIKFCRSIGLPPRKPLTHCTWFKSRTGPSWGIRQNWSRSDILRWMKILDPAPVRRNHWELVWYQKPDFPKTMFARIPPAAPREPIPRYSPDKLLKTCPEYKMPRKFFIRPKTDDTVHYIWTEIIDTKKTKKIQTDWIPSEDRDNPEVIKPKDHEETEKKPKVKEKKESRLMPKKICLTGLTGKDLLLARRLMSKPKFMKA